MTTKGVKLGGFTGTSNTSQISFGYCDVHSNRMLGGTTAYNPYKKFENGSQYNTMTEGTSGGDPIDISWAVYPARKEDGSETRLTGKPVHLPHIQFVRIYTGTEAMNGLFGEVSTEAMGIATVSNTGSGTTPAPVIKINGMNISNYVTSPEIIGNVIFYDLSGYAGASGTVTVTSDASNLIINKEHNGSYTYNDSTEYVRVIAQDGEALPYIAVLKLR